MKVDGAVIYCPLHISYRYTCYYCARPFRTYREVSTHEKICGANQ